MPPLEQGDTLSRDEFERRYNNMPHVKKAELIDGVVHMASPGRCDHHGSPHASIIGWLFQYRALTNGTNVVDNTTIRLDLDNEPQPDAALFVKPACGGSVRISDEDYIEGAPELVAEVAASSVSIDMNQKLHVYRRNQVREYIVWRTQDNEIDWFILRGGQYVAQLPNSDGLLCSEVFPGLWLDAAAMTDGDMETVIRAAQRGVESDEHKRFVSSLAGGLSRPS